MEGKKNRFFWLGDGSTYNEAKMTGGRESFFSCASHQSLLLIVLKGAWYLNDDQVDRPPGECSSQLMERTVNL